MVNLWILRPAPGLAGAIGKLQPDNLLDVDVSLARGVILVINADNLCYTGIGHLDKVPWLRQDDYIVRWNLT